MIRVSEQPDFGVQSYGVLGNLRLNTLRLCAFALIKSVFIPPSFHFGAASRSG
jgi:hypothetical protein